MKPNLLDFNLPQLTDHFAAMGEKPFRAKQIMRWMHQMGEADFDAMTDIAKSLRAKLHDCAIVGVPDLMVSQESEDGTRKWLLDVGTGTGRMLQLFAGRADRAIGLDSSHSMLFSLVLVVGLFMAWLAHAVGLAPIIGAFAAHRGYRSWRARGR